MNNVDKVRLQAYLLQDRQWTRPCRIAHANYQVSVAKDQDDKDFWQAVIEANEG